MREFDYSRIEATRLDYKVNLELKKPKSWLKSVSAFANTHGGYILFGVADATHRAIGLENPQEAASKISELIGSRIEPVPQYTLEEFYGETEDQICLALEIFCGPAYPYYYVHERTMEVYVRHGDRSEIASTSELGNLVLKGQNKTFDSLPTHFKLSDVSFTLLGATFKQETGNDFDMTRDLLSMGLLSESGQVTNAGLLLCDQGYLRQSRVVCTRWRGNQKGAVDGDTLDDQEYSGMSLISLLFNAETFVRNNSKNPWTIRGMRREENSDYPFRAVREVLVNAVIHRDYQLVGTEVHVDMFDDRMEITSPGGMLNGGCIQDFDLYRVPSMRRNAYISDLFGRLRFMDRRGSGIGRIMSAYSMVEQKPKFFSNAYYFSVVLPNRTVAAPAQTEPEMDIDNQRDAEKRQLSPEKSQLNPEERQLSPEKSQLSPEKSQLSDEMMHMEDDEDWELSSFKAVVLQRSEGRFREKTIESLLSIFYRYRYKYSFNRRNIADLLKIKENGASIFLKKCIEKGIIKKVKIDEYQFVKIDDESGKEKKDYHEKHF